MPHNTQVTTRPLHTVKSACAELHVGRTKLYQLIEAGYLKAVKIDRARRITGDSVESVKKNGAEC